MIVYVHFDFRTSAISQQKVYSLHHILLYSNDGAYIRLSTCTEYNEFVGVNPIISYYVCYLLIAQRNPELIQNNN
jgi:hypothetical protein